MTAYDSIERGAADEDERRRPRTFTLTHLLVACVAVCVCSIGATTAVTHRGLANFGWWYNPSYEKRQETIEKNNAYADTFQKENAELKSENGKLRAEDEKLKAEDEKLKAENEELKAENLSLIHI